MNKNVFIAAGLLWIIFTCGGCDFLLRILDKEMGEEKQLLGDISRYNQKIKDIQEVLKEIGYEPGIVDGRLGIKTRAAIEVFQKDYNLGISGYIDKKTWKEINMIQETNIIYFNKFDIPQVQTALKNAGFDPGPIDGKMGTETKKAVQQFQAKNGLVQDGKVGGKTWQELRKYLDLET